MKRSANLVRTYVDEVNELGSMAQGECYADRQSENKYIIRRNRHGKKENYCRQLEDEQNS